MSFPIIKDTYQFECTMCGNCCTGDQKVNLNLFDLYKMAVYKGYKNTGQLFENKLVRLLKSQNNSWLPQIKFRVIKSVQKQFKQDLRFCPFLINDLDEQNNLKGLCSLHPDKKPLICSLAPVGRILDLKNEKEEFVFVKPAPDCPGVEIKKNNSLSDIKHRLALELHYEKRFYTIIDSLVSSNPPKSFYLEHIYSFTTTNLFEDALSILEEKFN